MRHIWGLCVVLAAIMYGVTHVRAQDEHLPASIYQGRGQDLIAVSLETNVCPEVLAAANSHQFYGPVDRTYYEIIWQDNFSLRQSKGIWFIPPHVPCFQEKLAENDACPEETLRKTITHENGQTQDIFYYRRGALPCFNLQGQRLRYTRSDSWDSPLSEPYYDEMPYKRPPVDACLGDLVIQNPRLYMVDVSYYYQRGLAWPLEQYSYEQFVPEDIRHCRPIPIKGRTLYDLSHEENICIETILGASGLNLLNWNDEPWKDQIGSLLVPIDAPACYDAQGNRLGYTDRAIHNINLGESLLDVARHYDVCLQELWTANPGLNYWPGWTKSTTISQLEVLYIPDTPPCDQTVVTFKPSPLQTIYQVSLITNVCINRLIEANPQYPQLESYWSWTAAFLEELTLTIPKRHPCYYLPEESPSPQRYPNRWSQIIYYACYPVPVTVRSDFTGHVPSISVSDDPDLPYCEPRSNGMSVIYENARYRLYKTVGIASVIRMAECAAIAPQALMDLNARAIPDSVRPTDWLLVPDNGQECILDGSAWLQEKTPKLSKLDDQGVYTVDYGDTLRDIGWRYGYLPGMIAAENNLEAPYLIYPYQELQMPTMPSLYDIGKAMLYVAGVGVGMIGFGMYRMRIRQRSTSKKKNSEVKLV